MSVDLPQPIATYFTATKGDSETIARCFAENAVVVEHGHSYRGLGAIKQWKAEAWATGPYTNEPLASERKDGKIVVTSRLSGDFPGSPVDFRSSFALEGDKIASLTIMPIF